MWIEQVRKIYLSKQRQKIKRQRLREMDHALLPTYAKRVLDAVLTGTQNRERGEYIESELGRADLQKVRTALWGKEVCLQCRTPLNTKWKWFSLNKSPGRFCGLKCSNTNAETKRKKAEACLRNYGTMNPSQAEEIKVKKIETCIRNFGTEYPSQSEEVNRKIRERSQKDYGVNWPTASESSKRAVRITNMKNRGVPNPMQCPEVFSKQRRSSFKNKSVQVGNRVFSGLQGYEPQAVMLMKSLGFDLKKLKVGGEDNLKIDCGKRVYYPDFVYDNLVIEVKSTYTSGVFGKKTNIHKEVRRKMRFSERAGFKTRLLVLYHRKWLIVKNPLQFTRAEIRKAVLELKNAESPYLVLA